MTLDIRCASKYFGRVDINVSLLKKDKLTRNQMIKINNEIYFCVPEDKLGMKQKNRLKKAALSQA